jgi:hypothetical protein
VLIVEFQLEKSLNAKKGPGVAFPVVRRVTGALGSPGMLKFWELVLEQPLVQRTQFRRAVAE